MLHTTKNLQGAGVRTPDGTIGKVLDIFFDDSSWDIRYVVVDTGRWLSGRKVLLAPVAVRGIDRSARSLSVNLTADQVRRSPPIDADRPVSRQYEIDLHNHYQWPMYWLGGAMAGLDAQPEHRADRDHHLRSAREVRGYRVRAIDWTTGRVEDLIADDQEWKIRYTVVKTRRWLPGKKVVVPLEWVDMVRWEDQSVYVKVKHGEIKNARTFEPARMG
jgi:hypothetical protein